jgi:hypothetical protein
MSRFYLFIVATSMFVVAATLAGCQPTPYKAAEPCACKAAECKCGGKCLCNVDDDTSCCKACTCKK